MSERSAVAAALPPYAAHLAADGALVLEGDLDGLVVDQLREDLATHTDGYRTSLLVDLSDVTYLCSLAVSVLVRTMRNLRAHDADLELLAREGPAHRVLEICGIPHRQL